jgi:hypothetical protein
LATSDPAHLLVVGELVDLPEYFRRVGWDPFAQQRSSRLPGPIVEPIMAIMVASSTWRNVDEYWNHLHAPRGDG